MLRHNTKSVTLHNILFIFQDTGREFELEGGLLKRIIIRNYKVDLVSLSDEKLMYDFAKEMSFDIKARGNEFNRYRSLIRLVKSPGLLISASGVSKFLQSGPNDLDNRLILLITERHGGKNSDIINEENVVLVDNSLEYNCTSTKQHKQSLLKCNPLHTKKK